MRDFLKQTFATLLGIFIFLGLSVGGLLFLIIATATKDTGPQVKDKSVLVFDLSQNITDSRPNSSAREVVSDALSGSETDTISLRSVLDAIDYATQDPKIIALYLHGSDGNSSSGFATLKEVRKARRDLKRLGKKSTLTMSIGKSANII